MCCETWIGEINMKVIAKNDVRILMEDGRYSKFIKGNEYRCMLKGE